MNDRRLLRELELELQKLVDKECWMMSAGEGTGSRVGLDFGRKIPRKRPLPGIHLSEEKRNFIGEYWLFISDCAWRIDSETGPVCSWCDGNANDGPMVQTLRRLIGSRITSVSISPCALDLSIIFNNLLQLKLFCDQVNIPTNVDPEDIDNYIFTTPESLYVIGVRSAIQKRDRDR